MIMSILTIKDGVLEADFDQLIQRWSKDPNKIVGTSNHIECCPIATLLKQEWAAVYAEVSVFEIRVWTKDNQIKYLSPNSTLTDFIQGVDDYHSSEDEENDETVYTQEPVLASVGIEIIKMLRQEAQP